MSSGNNNNHAPGGGSGASDDSHAQQQPRQQPVAGPPQAPRGRAVPPSQVQQQAQAQAQHAQMLQRDPGYVHGAALRAYRSNVARPEAVYDDRLGQMVGVYRQIHDVGTTGATTGTGTGRAVVDRIQAEAQSGRTNVPWQQQQGGGGEGDRANKKNNEAKSDDDKSEKSKPKGPALRPPRTYGGRNIASVVVGRQLTPGGGRGRQNPAALRPMRGRTASIACSSPPRDNDNDVDGKIAEDEDDDGSSSTIAPSPELPTTTIATEIRHFGEHCSATKFHWSYLSSTGDALARSSHRNNQLAAQRHVVQMNTAAATANDGGGGGGEEELLSSLSSQRHQQPPPDPIPPSYQPTNAGVTDILTAHTAPARPAVSTISLSFSPDGRTLASTHGDHTVKITCCATGRLVRNLEGHPRTPWTVKYHPVDSSIVASGCLGFQVRVWDWNYRPYNSGRAGAVGGGGRTKGAGKVRRPHSPRAVVGGLEGSTAAIGGGSGIDGSAINHDVLPSHYTDSDPTRYDYHLSRGVCLAMIRLQYAIISLSFHPSGHILAAASGSKVHLWDWDDVGGRLRREREERRAARRMLRGKDDVDDEGGMDADENWEEGTRTGDILSTLQASGSASRSEERQIGGSGGELMEHGFTAALRCVHFPPSGKHVIIGGGNPQQNPRGGGMSGGGMTFNLQLHEFDLAAALDGRGGGNGDDQTSRRRLLTNPRMLTNRALLYNDGGFDVSTDGTKMCACVEYWIEDGIDDKNALIVQEIERVQHELHVLGAMNDSGDGGSDDEGRASTNTTVISTVSFSSPPRQGTIGSSSFRTPTSTEANRQGSGNFPSKFALDNPKTPPPAMIRSNVFQTPPSPPGRRGQAGAPSEGGDGTSANTSTPPRGQGTDGTGRNVVPMPSLSRRQAIAGRRRRRDGRGYADGPPPHRHGRHDTSTGEEGPDGEPIGGRWVPHVVTLSLSTDAPSYVPQSTCLLKHELSRDPPIGNVIRACRLAGPKASGVTCVKFSPSADYCLLGYGVRENAPQGGDRTPHPVTAVYGSNREHTSDDGSMTSPESQLVHVTTLRSSEDDVNIARFHPESGHGFVYGTKQGRVRVLDPRPWNYYYA